MIQRKDSNDYRIAWSTKGEAALRTMVTTARKSFGAGAVSKVLVTTGAGQRVAKLGT